MWCGGGGGGGFFFQAEDGIRDSPVTGVQTCALPILIPVSNATGDGMVDLESALSRIINLGEEVED